VACGPGPAPEAIPEPIEPVAAEVAFQVGGCPLCHQVPGMVAATRQESCQDCHVWIRAVSANPTAREAALAAFPLWERYENNVASYLEVPSLEVAMARLEPSWVREWLADPHDVRPGLPETMPRFGLDEAHLAGLEAAFSAALVAVQPAPAPDPSRVAEGETLYRARVCRACHAFGGRPATPGIPMAPDLAHARDRLDPSRAVAWIQDPQAVHPAATMPNLGLTREQAIALRDFLWLAEPGWAPAEPLGADLPVHEEPVSWAEVEAAVFGKICAHCHMNPDLNEGRRGPGNAGGFGYPPTGVELQTLEGVRAVGAEVLTRVLLDRRAEEHRDTVSYGEQPAELVRPERPGMPMGLPALPDSDIALVLAWVEQGMPE